MAGILAESASVTMVSGDTATSKTLGGFVSSEQVSLSTTPTGTNYAWTLSIPSDSSSSRSGLSASTGASVTFTPDVDGTYVVGCTVDSTTVYTLVMTVTAATVASTTGGMHFLPRTDASVPTPATGVTLYYSSDQSALATKDSAGAVSTVNLTAV